MAETEEQEQRRLENAKRLVSIHDDMTNIKGEQPEALRRAQQDSTFVPKRLLRAQQIYDLMEQAATYDPNYSANVFEGSVTKLLEKIGLTKSLYSDVVAVLKDTQAVLLVQRGNRDYQSRWALNTRPTHQAYTNKNEGETSGKSHAAQLKSHQQQIGYLNSRLYALEEAHNTLLERINSLLDPQTPTEKRAARELETIKALNKTPRILVDDAYSG